MDNNLEKLKEWLSFAKFMLGTVLIALIGSWVDSRIKLRQQEVLEVESTGKFIQYALTENVGSRKRFAEFFANTVRTGELKEGWKDYYKVVYAEYRADSIQKAGVDSAIVKIDKEYKLKMIDTQAKYANDKDRLVTEMAKQKEVYQAEKQKLIVKEQVLEENLTVKPIPQLEVEKKVVDDPPVEQTKAPAIAPGHPLVASVESFLSDYPSSCFNAERVRDWGGKKRAHQSLKDYSYDQIKQALEILKQQGKVVQGECKESTLYSIKD